MENKVYFIRKSKWLLVLIVLKTIILISFLSIVLYWLVSLSTEIKEHSLTSIVIFLLYILTFFIYVNIIFPIVFYFYDIVIINHKSIYRFKLWLLFSEYVYILDLYKIQEVDSHVDGMLHVILNIWELHLIELNDKENKIHFLDNPQEIAHNIRELQYKFVDKKTTVDNRFSRQNQ